MVQLHENYFNFKIVYQSHLSLISFVLGSSFEMIVYHVPIYVKWELPTFLMKHELSCSFQATPTIRIYGLFNHKSY